MNRERNEMSGELESLMRDVGRVVEGEAQRQNLLPQIQARLAARQSLRGGPGRAVRTADGRWSVALAFGSLAACAATAVIALRPHAISYAVAGVGQGEVGAALVAPAAAPLELQFSDGSAVTLPPRAAAHVDALDRDGATVAIEEGTLEVSVIHRTHTRWQVQAGGYHIQVTGTRFAAGWDRQSRALTVTMHEGSVLVSGPGLKEPVRVVTGQHLRASASGADLGLESAPGPSAEVAAPPSAPAPIAAAPRSPEPALAPPPSETIPPADRASAPRARRVEAVAGRASTPINADWRVQAARAEYHEALAAAVLEGWRAECARLGADDLVLLGDVARLAGESRSCGGGLSVGAPPLPGRRPPDLRARPHRLRGAPQLQAGRGSVRQLSALVPARAAGARGGGPFDRIPAEGRRRPGGAPGGDLVPARFPGRAPRHAGQTYGRSVICGRGGIQAAVALALLAAATVARAGPDLPAVSDLPEPSDRPPRVALFSAVANDPLAGRIDAELRAVGVDVSRAAIAPARGIEEQVRGALGAGARAVVVADGHRTDVWIAQVGSDRIGLRQELEVDETSGLQAVLALRTVEFLRISLGLVSEPNVVPLPAVRPTVARAVPPAPAPRRWLAIDASSGVLASAGGGGATAIAGVSVRAQLWRILAAELCFYAPLSEAAVTGADGEARTSAWLAGGGLVIAPRPDGRASIEVGAGTLATWIRSDGIPATGAEGFNTRVLRAALYGRGAARFRLAPRLSLRLDVIGGTVINPPPITFVSTQVATWGSAFAAGLGGAELRF